MNEKELLLKEIEENVKSLIIDATKENIKKHDVEKAVFELNEKIKSLDNQGMSELKSRIDSQNILISQLESASKLQGAEMVKMKEEKSVSPKQMTFRESIKQAILDKKEQLLVSKKDDNGERLSLKDYFTERGNQVTPTFQIKAAVDMLQSNIVGNYVNYLRLAELDPKRVGIPLTIYPHVLQVFPQKNIQRPTMSLLVVYTYWDGTATKVEGTASAQSSFLFKTVEFKSFNISTHFKISDETLDDLNEALDEISVTAPDKILDAVDSKIFVDGGNGTSDIMGLFVGGTTCTDFNATTYENTVDGANLVDVISKMKLNARKNKYRANFVGLNATDIDNIQSLKDTLDNSISDRRLVFNSNGELVKVCGLTVVENDSITANTAIVGDTSQAMIGVRKDMTLEIALDGTDFTEGQKTVRLGIRLAFGVRDKAAFIYSSSLSADLALIKI